MHSIVAAASLECESGFVTWVAAATDHHDKHNLILFTLPLTSRSRTHSNIAGQKRLLLLFTERNGRKTLTTVQGIPTKFDQKKILKVIKKKFACNGTIVNDEKMGEVIQLQGDQRKDVERFLIDKDEGLDIDAKTIKVHGF